MLAGSKCVKGLDRACQEGCRGERQENKRGCMMIQGNEFFTKMEMSVFTEKYSALTLGL